jgi:hypothetical protein
MTRTNLRVPYGQRNEARALGARWDARLKTWYVPAGMDPTPLRHWIPVARPPNVRAAGYFLATTERACWRCGAITRVVGFVLPAGYEVLNVEDDPAYDCWEVSTVPTILSYVVDLPDSVAAALPRRAPRLTLDFSQTTQTFYWMNHCEHCAAKLGDFETFEEWGVGFMPTSSIDAARIHLQEVAEPFSASCGSHTRDLEWFEHAQRVPAPVPPSSLPSR